jgi:vacuolar-type H+-ATPase subunit H
MGSRLRKLKMKAATISFAEEIERFIETNEVLVRIARENPMTDEEATEYEKSEDFQEILRRLK